MCIHAWPKCQHMPIITVWFERLETAYTLSAHKQMQKSVPWRNTVKLEVPFCTISKTQCNSRKHLALIKILPQWGEVYFLSLFFFFLIKEIVFPENWAQLHFGRMPRESERWEMCCWQPTAVTEVCPASVSAEFRAFKENIWLNLGSECDKCRQGQLVTILLW